MASLTLRKNANKSPLSHDHDSSIRQISSSAKGASKGMRRPIYSIVTISILAMVMILDPNNIGFNDADNWTEFDSHDLNKISFDWNYLPSVKTKDGATIISKSLGPHKVEIMTQCDSAIFWAKVSKDALVDVKLDEISPRHWVGTFSLPMEGEYVFQVKWAGCKTANQRKPENKAFEPFEVRGMSNNTQGTDSMFANGAWISSSKLPQHAATKSLPEYVWIDPDAALRKENVVPLKNAENTFIVKEGIVSKSKGFFEFRRLSNYELVCFLGGTSAEELRRSFLSLRSELFPGQRPFKFHYYKMTSFATPDATWNQELKEKFRKCKHVLISLDQPEQALTQSEYRLQVTTLIRHITTALDDETFPVWMFTTLESPINGIMNNRNCRAPSGRRSSDHPCNTALKNLFRDSPFSSRVRLLDNTDLTNPDINDVSSREAILAAVALRIYVLVGKQVKEWRDKGQIGHINGLTKGDKEIPNFVLVPYDFTRNLTASLR